MRSLIKIALSVALGFGLVGIVQAENPSMGVVVKIGGIPWFNAMEEGIKERAAELGMDAEMIGPTSADPALQVRAIEDLIAKGVNVIGVVPNDEAALEPVLKKPWQQALKLSRTKGQGLVTLTGTLRWLRRTDSVKRMQSYSPRR